MSLLRKGSQLLQLLRAGAVARTGWQRAVRRRRGSCTLQRLTALPCACLCLLPVPQVKRAKKCLDHAGTLFFLHLVVVICFSGFPRRVAW